jgi:acyl carrier protein
VTGAKLYLSSTARTVNAVRDIMMTDSISREIRDFVVGNFLFGQSGNLTDDQSFLEHGIIDSTGILELVAFLEERFSISIADRELLPENLDSVQNASSFIARKLQAQGAQVAG